jgi:hypothetical protein
MQVELETDYKLLMRLLKSEEQHVDMQLTILKESSKGLQEAGKALGLLELHFLVTG